jgi:hypothetical protein
MNKDFRLILDAALAVRAPMPTTAAALPFNNAEFEDHPDCNFCAVLIEWKTWQKLISKSRNEIVSHSK